MSLADNGFTTPTSATTREKMLEERKKKERKKGERKKLTAISSDEW